VSACVQTCDEYEQLVDIVDTALGVRPDQISPLDVIDVAAPPTWEEKDQAKWQRARDQHVALAKSARMPPSKKGLLTDGCLGHANVRWIERFCMVPDVAACRKGIPPGG
jgi:hypothetical protein